MVPLCYLQTPVKQASSVGISTILFNERSNPEDRPTAVDNVGKNSAIGPSAVEISSALSSGKSGISRMNVGSISARSGLGLATLISLGKTLAPGKVLEFKQDTLTLVEHSILDGDLEDAFTSLSALKPKQRVIAVNMR